MIRAFFSGLVYRYGWDTRCRNRCSARALQALLTNGEGGRGPVLLDVGCGKLGVATYLRKSFVVGSDLQLPVERAENFLFVRASATVLPFRDRAFPAVSCVDVLEHVEPRARLHIIRECVRVASGVVLLAFPSGQEARRCDVNYQQACQRRRRPVPDWVDEHLRYEHPVMEAVTEQVQQAAQAFGSRAQITVSFCEPLAVSYLVRAAAARSTFLYVLVNMVFGMCLPFVPQPHAKSSYRTILLAELFPRDNGQLHVGVSGAIRG